MILFADLIKGQPTGSAAHVRTALGNEHRRRRFKPQWGAFIPTQKLAGRSLTPMDAFGMTVVPLNASGRWSDVPGLNVVESNVVTES